MTLGSSIVNVADKATHISQLEMLGRQQISRDIMPILKRNIWIDGHALESENAIPATHGKQVNHIHDKADTEARVHTSQLENGVGQVVQNCKPLVAVVPKPEPVEQVIVPPKESKRIRRKTTLRREGRDDFLQITFGETTDWQPDDLQRIRQENIETIDVHKKALIRGEMTGFHSDIRGASLDLESFQKTQHSVGLLVSAAAECPGMDTVGADVGLHWLKPKPKHVHGD